MSKWETIGHIGVDSGTIMVIDPCYIVPDEEWSDSCSEYSDKDGYDKCYAAMKCGGVWVTTAHGDGEYPVEARYNNHGQIVEIRVKFEWPDDEDY